MNDTASAPGWFKVVAIIGLLWNLLGVLAYFWYTAMMERFMTPEVMATLPEAERAQMETQLQMLQATPAWATGAFAIAVFGGLLGCILLLMKRKLAVPVFGLSLAGIIVQNVHSLGIAKVQETVGGSAFIQPAIVLAFGILLLWMAMKASKEGWSR